jgi:hypothetical protein
MEHTIRSTRNVDFIYIPKPPVSPQSFIASKTEVIPTAAIPVLVFQRHKKLDEYGFEWDYLFVREENV